MASLFTGPQRLSRKTRRRGVLAQRRRTRLWGEMLEPRLMMAVDTPDIVVGRVLSAYSIADVQNNELKITYTVYNQEAEDVSGVLLTSTLQSGVTFIDATQLPDQNGQELAWSLGTIPAYGRASVELTVDLANNTILTIDDGAEAFSTLNARASTDAAPPAVLKATPLPAALLASTVDANATDPFIQEQAARLDYAPQKIIDFLQDEIGYESYTGSLRGARGTLWSNAGNALDEASLGVALFRASGIPAQYAAGTLSDPLAQQLILSMFPESYQIVGYIPPGTEVSDPANDPQLLTETKQHYWIQFETAGGLQNIDTTFASSTIGQTFTGITSTFSEVANDLRHKVQIDVTVEKYSQAGALFGFGDGLSTTTVLSHTFDAAYLVGRPLTLGHFVNEQVIPSPILTSRTITYSPFLVIGDEALIMSEQEHAVRGTDFQEVLTNLPLGSSFLTGLFLKMTLTSPGLTALTYDRSLVDRIGYAARSGFTTTNVSVDPNGPPVVNNLSVWTLAVLPGRANPHPSAAQRADLAAAESELIGASNATVAAQSARQHAIAGTRQIAHSFASTSDAMTKRIEEVTSVRAYAHRPRLIIVSQLYTVQQDTATLGVSIDLRRDTLRAIAHPGQDVIAPRTFHTTRGLFETALEGLIIQQIDPTRPVENTAFVMAAAEDQDIPLVQLNADNLVLIETLDLPLDAKARISMAVQAGHVVIVPSAPVLLGSKATTAWYQLDPSSGELIGVTSDGGHQGVIEYAVALGFIFTVDGVLLYIASHPNADLEKLLASLKKAKHDLIGLITGSAGIFSVANDVLYPLALFEAGVVFALALLTLSDPDASQSTTDPVLPPLEPANAARQTATAGSTISAGSTTGIAQIQNVAAAGQLVASWNTTTSSVFRVHLLNIGSATVTDGNGATVGSGAVALALTVPMATKVTGNNQYTVTGTGTLAFYGPVESPLGVGGNWDNYTANVTGNVTIAITTDELMLNGTLLPPGTYTITTAAATLVGSGVTGSPNFAGTATVTATNGTVNLGPGTGSVTIGGNPLPTESGFTLSGYNGTINVTANGNADTVALNGSTDQVLRITGNPSAISSDQNTPATFAFQVNTSLADTYDFSAAAPEGWTVTIGDNNQVTVTPKPGTQSGTFAVRLVARSQSNPDLVAAVDVVVTVTPTLPELTFDVVADPVFTVPFNGAQVPTSFRATMQNLGPVADTYNLTFPNPPAGFNIIRSANSLTVPAGETGITGIYLEPNGVMPAPGTSVSFTVTATSQTNPLITQTETFTFQMPSVAAVTVETNPVSASTIPGAPVTADVTIKNVGNVPYNLAIGASLPSGLTLSGLTTPVVLAVGQSTTQTVTLTPAANTLNSTLTPTFTYGPAVAANLATVVQIDTGDAFVEAGQAVSVSATVFAGVLQAQQGSITYVVKNAQGTVVHTSAAIPLALAVVAATQSVNLGTINTAGFTTGQYTIEAMVRDASNQSLPGALGVGKFVVGLPISAVQDVSPNTVAEGLELTYVTNNATVESSVLVSLQPLVSIIDTNGTALNIALQGNLVYVAGTKEVTIVDLVNPASPQIVGSFGAAQLSQDSLNVAQIVGGNLVIGSQSSANQNNSNIIVYSLANPLSPQFISNTSVPYRFITDLLVQGNMVVIPTSGVTFTLPGTIIGQFGDVVTVNLANPASPALADVLFNTNGSPNGGTTRQTGGTIVNSSLAYIGSSTFTGSNTTTGNGRVLIVNIANPSNITVAGELQIPGIKQVLDIAIDGNRALVVGSSGGLRNPFNGFGDLGLDGTLTLTVLDITNPQSPTILGTTLVTEAKFPSGTAPGMLQAVSLGNQQFAVSGVRVPQQGPVLVVVDATDPAAIEARNLDVPALVNGLSVTGNFLHASSAAGLATYRIDALVEKSVQVSVRVPTGTGVDVAENSFNISPSQIVAGAGFDTLVWDLTLGADHLEQELTWNVDLAGFNPGTTRAITLGATIDYGGTTADLSLPAQIVAATPATQTLQLPVRVVVPGADAIATASVTAGQLGQTDLANRLSDLTTALTNLVQNPTSEVFHSQAVASLSAVIPLVANDAFSGSLVAVLQGNQATLAAAATPAAIQSALQALATTLGTLNSVLLEEVAHGFTISLLPNSAIVLPGVPTQFSLGVQNTGNQLTTYQLAVTGLPANVTAVFMQNGQPIQTFALQPGQADNGTVNGGIEPIALFLTETGGSLFPAGFSVTVSAIVAPQISQSVAGSLAVRAELIDVISVEANPAFTQPGGTVDISARILSAVNAPRQALAYFTITDPLNTVIYTSTPASFPLSVQTTLATANLGAFNTTGLAKGDYEIDVIVTDLLNQPIPGVTGQGKLQVGLPVGATLTVTPVQSPPGTSTVVNTLEVTGAGSIPDTLTFFGQVQTTPSATTVTLYQAGAQRLAYVGGTNGVDIVDVTNPASPQKLSTFAGNLIVQGGFTGVRIQNVGGVDYLIVGSQVGSNGNRFTLLLYSLANPTNPVLVNTPTGTPISHVFASDFLVSGNTIVVPTQGASGFFPSPITTQFGNVLSVNISNPAAPVLTDVLFDSPGPPNSGTTRQPGGAIIDNQIAYITSTTSTGGNLAAGVGRVLVVDYSNPTQLQLLRELQVPGTHHALTIGVQGNRAILVSSTGGLVDFVSPLAGNLAISVLDITDHSNPQLLGTTLVVNNSSFPPPSGGATKLSVLPLSNGLFAISEILVNGSPVLLLVDPSDPNNIVVTQTPTPNLLNEMAVSGNLLYTTSSAGVTIYEVFGSINVTASVQIPNGTGVTIIPNSFSTPPTQTIPGPTFDTLVWQLAANAAAPTTITWQSTVSNLQIDERRPVALGATVDFTSQGTPGQLAIPATEVIGQHIISVTPEVRTVRPGETSSYVVTVRNPGGAAATYNLSFAGVPGAWGVLPASVLVPANGSVDVPLTLTSSTFATLMEYGFAVTASLAGTPRDFAPARLIVAGAPVIDRDSHGVVTTLAPATVTAGQGVPATFTVRVINTGSATDTFNLTAMLPAGFTVAFEQTSVVVPPGASNFREISVQVTPPLGTSAASYPVTFTATSATLPAIVGSSAGNVNVVSAGVDVSLNPAAAPAGTTFQLTVRNTGTTTDTFSLALASPGALVSTLAQASVTLAPGASQIVNVNVATINFAVQPSLQLAAIATSQNNSAVKDMASAEITIPLTFAMASEFEEDTITLATPGPGTFLLLVENLGNGEDAYEAEIITTTGPLSATLIGLDGSAVQKVPIFRLPGLSTGSIVLNANLAANGNGTITVRVRSLTNDNIISQSVATLRSTVTDFGDAPDSYGTLLANNGARHFAVGPQLGAARDPETDGQPTSTALGDDNTSLPDDEDGVVLPGLFVAGTCDCSGTGLGNSITVNASAAGFLDAWIDFNRNGQFDASEQIATSLRVAAGANTFSVSVPTTASAGSTYARFRISSAGGLAPTGEAADGEVEDYAVQLFNPSNGSSGIIVDPNNPAGRVLYVKGTAYSDAIVVRQTSASTVTVYVAPFGTTRSFALNSFDRIVICGGAGSDAIAIEAPIAKPSVIYGDEDNDSISGGLGPDIIFGGAGVDSIAGWAGDDTISGGAGIDTISGGDGFDRLLETGSGVMTLTNTLFKIGNENNPIAYFEAATLIGGSAADSFNVTGWSWPLTIDGAGGTNTLIDGGNANFTLTETSLLRAGSTTRTIALSSIQNVSLTGGSGNNTFDLSAWPFSATLNGDQGTDSFIAFGESNFTLSDTMLMRPSLGMLRLNSLENATLNGTSSANTFNVSHWTKTATLNGFGGNDKLVASGNMDFTLSNSTLTRSSAGVITLSSIEQAELVGGASNNTLNAATFTGEVKLDGGEGNDTLSSGAGIALLLGGTGNDVLTAGSGRALLIGGLGLDRITGGSNDDLLIAGQTVHDSDAAALALILAEWASASSYLDRVAHLTGATGGLNGGKTLSGTNVIHDSAIDILLGSAGDDLFFAKLTNPAQDSLSDKSGNETAI